MSSLSLLIEAIFINVMIFFLAPASPPASVITMSNTSTSINVMWSEVPPIDQNGVIIAYEITYTPLKNFIGVIGTNSKNMPVSDLSVGLVGLQEYVNYSIQVRAYTSEGPGPYSNPVIQLTLEDSKSMDCL